ncbi:hypothetical protein J4E89_009549 [Alternaria sp. Ai002NY15]|nr:hypothetical protein J4E89_009549 [Alternaria sp. Ai002NY15]
MLDRRFLINWCFRDALAENNIFRAVDNGWGTWTRKLGAAQASNGHNLHFERFKPVGGPNYPYCYTSPGVWDPQIPPETVVVYWIATDPMNREGFASVGHTVSNVPGRHHLMISGHTTDDNRDFTVAHELGHIFGLNHEHERSDRDQYIIYNCRNVEGFAEAWGRCLAEDPTCTEDMLCNDRALAIRHGFIGSEFITYNIAPDIASPYDYQSIMHYDSRRGSNEAIVSGDRTNPTLYPMFKVDPQTNQAAFLRLAGGLKYPEFEISDGDAQMIRAMYPF